MTVQTSDLRGWGPTVSKQERRAGGRDMSRRKKKIGDSQWLPLCDGRGRRQWSPGVLVSPLLGSQAACISLLWFSTWKKTNNVLVLKNYLSERQTERVRDRAPILIHLFTPQMLMMAGPGPKLRAKNSIQVSHVGGRNPIPWAWSLPPRLCISRKLESRGRARNQTQTLQDGIWESYPACSPPS